ncbi:MAG: hypothetical protein J3Q66DRAFT_347358 [Benniella sp.]|nr:MAG: hypothetical protein J3Q66DRAFT_347358 [Benniella sp.]
MSFWRPSQILLLQCLFLLLCSDPTDGLLGSLTTLDRIGFGSLGDSCCCPGDYPIAFEWRLCDQRRVIVLMLKNDQIDSDYRCRSQKCKSDDACPRTLCWC